MKKLIIIPIILGMLCAIFISTFNSKIVVSADFCLNETISFEYKNQVFNYELNKNIKKSSQFDLNYEINKYNRFGSKNERILLTKHLVSLGFDKNVVIEYLFPNINETINKIEKTITVKPKDAKLFFNSNSEKVFTIQNEIIGVKLNKDKIYSSILNKFINNEEMIIPVYTTKIVPEITKNDFKYTNLRADFSTDISSSSPDRKHNVKTALQSLNGVELAPNETFSFNKTIGKRTKENGYREAKIIVNNEFVEGLGGGVCQVSSTLYNAVLLAGLEIKEANKHSKQVGYVKYGFDAMVNFGSSDLKFVNNTNEKIVIVTNYSNSKARIRIFGEDLNNVKYKLINEIVSETEPTEEIKFDEANEYTDKVIYDDESFYLVKPNKGMEIKSYRKKYVNGVETKCELLRYDKFKVQNGIKIYGNKKRTENICAVL